MKVLRIRRADATPDRVAGHLVAHELRDASGATVFAKGSLVAESRMGELMALGWDELHLIAPDADEMHEEEAGQRIALAAAGEGIHVGAMSGGHWPLTATHRGILRADAERLEAINSVEGVCVYTLTNGQVVDEGELVARAKIIPFVLAARLVAAAEEIARGAGGVAHVTPFRPMTVGAVVRETLGERAMMRFRESVREKVEWFGSRLLEPRFVTSTAEAVAAAIEGAMADGADFLLMAGTKAMDPLDPSFVALDRLGVKLERYGVPVHPGSLLWLANHGRLTIVGMPTCGLFTQATVFDLLFPRMLAGERLTKGVLSSLGHGGLLTREMAGRFPPYRKTGERGAIAES
ncbi:MAG TPA: hypothetical protein VEI06_05995 [Gemmatimonadaceae bacterium]|nr:hypothetical protein [Gemmatimonadaceae bacterium]